MHRRRCARMFAWRPSSEGALRMSFAPRSKVAFAGLVSLLSLAFATTSCTGDGRIKRDDDSVTEVPHSAVKDQSTNNCWVYATTGWAESLHLAATGEELDLSESYLTYWFWFEQIVNGSV